MLFAISLFLMLNIGSGEAEQYGTMKGTILTVDGEALSEAQVCFYNVKSGPPPFSGEYWRVCEYVTHTGDDGSFAQLLPSGEYYVMATKKTSGDYAGPPVEEGDPTWPPWDGSELQTYMITEEGPTDLGVVPGAVPFKKEWLPRGKTAVEGRVLLKDGTPVEGVLVLASGDPKIKGLVFVSDRRTGTDGKYIVRVGEDGVYYLRAKGSGKSDEKAMVMSGEITKDIDIRVKENPSSRGDKWKKQKKEK